MAKRARESSDSGKRCETECWVQNAVYERKAEWYDAQVREEREFTKNP